MRTNTPTAQETAAPESTAVDLDAPVFGVDCLGGKHRFDDGDVIITRGGDVEHHEADVGREGVDRWIGYVRQKRGWYDVWWHADGAETIARLADALRDIHG